MKKRLLISFVIALVMFVVISTAVMAIALPDSTPTVEEIYCYRNIIETGDFLIIILILIMIISL